MSDQQDNSLDNGLLFVGFFIGLLVGGIIALFRTPRSGADVRQQLAESGESVRDKLESVVSDPVADSMAEGKAAARRRRLELGFKD